MVREHRGPGDRVDLAVTRPKLSQNRSARDEAADHHLLDTGCGAAPGGGDNAAVSEVRVTELVGVQACPPLTSGVIMSCSANAIN
jgi:hypothetical protein